MIVLERRASTVLFNLLEGLNKPGCFLLPANVCPIVPLTFLKARRPFEFVDISPATFCMDLGSALRIVRSRSKDIAGILFVRTYGALQDVETSLASIKTEAPDITIIDDRCLCPPERFETPSGAADAVLYSTGYAKFADIGFGGYGVIKTTTSYISRSLPFDADALANVTKGYNRAIQQLQPFEYEDSNWLDTARLEISEKEYWATVFEAAERANTHKEKLNQIYRDLIPADCQLAAEFQGWRFNVLVNRKESLISDVFNAGLFASSHYSPLTGIFSAGRAPLATRLHDGVVNLFNDHYFDEDKATIVGKIVRQHIDLTKRPMGLLQ